MRYIRAGGVTTFVLSFLTAAAMTGFSAWYANLSSSEMFERLVLWFGLGFVAAAPLCLVIFPLLHLLLGFGARPAGRLFALIGGAAGAAVAAYALFRFKGAIFSQSGMALLAIPGMVVGATLLGYLGGFLFERMARHPKAEPVVIPPVGARAASDEGRVSETHAQDINTGKP